MILIKEKIDKIMLLSNKVMKNNETEAPQIKALLQPSLTLIKKSFPNFYRAGTQYFVNMETLIDSASTNQILSSASAKISREIFGKNWEEFCQTIDSLTHTKPPPHTKEIISKFQSISSSMEYIKTSNENRKYPTSGLTKYINNVQSLCDDVCNNVIELFSQPSFPFFEIDLNAMLHGEEGYYYKDLKWGLMEEEIEAVLGYDIGRAEVMANGKAISGDLILKILVGLLFVIIGIEGIAGHRLVGGMRASIYNAVSMESVEALAAYMREFEAKQMAGGRSL